MDSSVLLDVLSADPRFLLPSAQALREAHAAGALLICPTVWAEVRAHFTGDADMAGAMSGAGVAFDPYDAACSDLAGQRWQQYRRAGGPRQHLIADFLIGAHAEIRGGRLLSRDRGFYRRYFPGLTVLPQR